MSKKRILVILALGLAAGFAAFQAAPRFIKAQIERALGSRAVVDSVQLRLAGVEIRGLAIRQDDGDGKAVSTQDLSGARAPTHLARVERIVIEPSLIDLVFFKWVAQTIRIEGASVVIRRGRDGKILLPMDGDVKADPAPKTPTEEAPKTTEPAKVKIERIEIIGGSVDFYDMSVSKTSGKNALHLRLEQINAAMGKIGYPDLTGVTTIDLTGVLKGSAQDADGKVVLTGGGELATLDSGLTFHLWNADLVLLQPYFESSVIPVADAVESSGVSSLRSLFASDAARAVQSVERSIQKGRLDLEVKLAIRQKKLNAPGKLTIRGLSLHTNARGAFLGIPYGTLNTVMKNRLGEIPLSFTLSGDINQPKLALDGTQLATQVGSSIADYFGVRLPGRSGK